MENYPHDPLRRSGTDELGIAFFIAVLEIPITLVKRILIACGLTGVKKVRTITSYLRLYESRTTLLARTLNAQWFQGKTIDQLSNQLMINACDLTHGSAFYFSPNGSGSWRLGKLTNNKLLVAEAVAASAAYPLALPALDKTYSFSKTSGNPHSVRVSLTDGGVYDNTALSPFWPSRDKKTA